MSGQRPKPCWVCKVTSGIYRVDLYEDEHGVRIKRFFTDETLPEELKVKLGMIYAASRFLPNVGQRVIGEDCRVIISHELLEFLTNADHDT